MAIQKIVSGGQTGVDRAAFDAALRHGISIGGFVPKGRWAEDGTVPARYAGLIETGTPEPSERTRMNVISSDGTLIFYFGKLEGGSLETAAIARSLGKPLLIIDLDDTPDPDAAAMAADWVRENQVTVLNIAGPRASEAPGIYENVTSVLNKLFG